MKKAVGIALLFAISLSSSSCCYYKGMPEEWKTQVINVDHLETFTGHYKLSFDNESVAKGNDYNDLRYFQNTSIYGRWLVKIPNLTSIHISATNAGIAVRFFSDEKLVYENFFDKKSVELKNGALKLNLKNQFEADDSGFVTVWTIPTVTMYKTMSNEVIVRRRETMVGTIFIVVPAITGQNYWFKLSKQASP